MLLCLSSGSTKRYRQDILRAASAPEGTNLRFRYRLKYLPENLKESVKKNGLTGEEVCVAYIDSSTVNKPPELVPCRKATLLKSTVFGDFCVLDFKLNEFWVAPDLKAFNKEIYSAIPNLPHWKDNKLSGYFCAETNFTPSSLVASFEFLSWQGLVSELSKFSDFQEETFYYYIQGVFNAVDGSKISPSNNSYNLLSDAQYEIRLIHYSPSGLELPNTENDSWLSVASVDDSLSLITNNKMYIDSSYDEKIVRFVTENISKPTHSVVSFYRYIADLSKNESEKGIWDFDLLFSVKPKTWDALWKGFLIGSLIAGQGLVLLFNNPHIENKGFVSVIIVLFGLCAGLVASFGLKKI